MKREGALKKNTQMMGADDRSEGVGGRSLIDTAFLTKDTIEIPNLFLSYITDFSMHN